jgi:hypothetical protein
MGFREGAGIGGEGSQSRLMPTSVSPVGTICGAMAVVPVFCNNCGTLFATESLLGGDWRQVSFKNVGFGPCPVCAGTGQVLDGTYDLIGDTIRVLSAPEWSLERLGWLQERIAAARAGLVAPEAVVDEVAAASPELAALVRPCCRRAGRLFRSWWLSWRSSRSCSLKRTPGLRLRTSHLAIPGTSYVRGET